MRWGTRRSGTPPNAPTIFAEVDPNQKERIILALQKTGHVVGYMGDGINDAPALHAADVGISVDTAVDVAKDAADLVLLEQDLDILRDGIDEGRGTFANTLKYILTTISANFGNMFSMARRFAVPAVPAAARPADPAQQLPVRHSRHDDRQRQCGPGMGGEAAPLGYQVHPPLHGALRSGQLDLRLSDLWDAAVPVSCSAEEFRTGWFIESLLTELVIALVVRTRRLFFRSRPGKLCSRARSS